MTPVYFLKAINFCCVSCEWSRYRDISWYETQHISQKNSFIILKVYVKLGFELCTITGVLYAYMCKTWGIPDLCRKLQFGALATIVFTSCKVFRFDSNYNRTVQDHCTVRDSYAERFKICSVWLIATMQKFDINSVWIEIVHLTVAKTVFFRYEVPYVKTSSVASSS